MQKQIGWLIWGVPLAMLLLGSGWIATTGQWLIVALLVAHLVEFVVNRQLFEREGGSMGHHFVQTMLFGLLHWKPIKERFEAEDSA